MPGKLKLIFFGDIDGKIGRQAVDAVLPAWQRQYHPNIILANADNITHGRGVNAKHVEQLQAAGIDIFTAGDHTLERPEAMTLLSATDSPVLRPANLHGDIPGRGAEVFSIRQKRLLVISLLGKVFIDKEDTDSPFITVDQILATVPVDSYDAVLIDLHAEATSEKSAFSWHVDGRVAVVVGTHTHVQTADERILPGGTAAITDVGFCGAVDSVIGVDKQEILNHFLTGKNFTLKIPEKGPAIVNAVYVEINGNGAATKIERLQKQVEIS